MLKKSGKTILSKSWYKKEQTETEATVAVTARPNRKGEKNEQDDCTAQ